MSIARNTFHYTLALLFQKALGFVYFAILARALGVENTGLYVFALSFTTIFSVLADIGFSPVLTREIAKDRTQTQKLFSQVFTVKIVVSLITYALVVFCVNLLGYSDLTKTLVYLAGGVMFLDSFSLMFWAVFRGYQNLKLEASGVVAHQTITVLLGLVALYLGMGVKALLAASLAASFFYAVYSFSQLVVKINIRPQILFDLATIKWFAKTALPFALAGIFARIYTQTDTVMLSKLGCATAADCDLQVGWYGTASKITLALQFIPLALSASLFPAMSAQHALQPDRLADTFSLAWRYLALIVLPISGGVAVLAPDMVLAIWGSEFLPAVAPLRMLMLSLVFLFLTFPQGSLLNASGRQLANTINMAVAVTINVVLNVLLINKYQMTGAAVASIISTFSLFILGFYKTQQLIKLKLAPLLFSIMKMAAASIVMVVALVYLKGFVSWILLIPLGAVIYLGLAFLLREVKAEDLDYCLKYFREKS